jgi:hypothetical protein
MPTKIMPAKKVVKKTLPKVGRPQMPGYGIPTSKKGLLPWKWAEQRLTKSHNYWFSTVKADGSPHTMVIWGLWRDGAFSFCTGSKSQKTRNLERNSKCVVCTEDADEAVIVEGVAESMPLAQRREFLKRYNRKYEFDMSGMEKDILAGKEPVFVVRARVVFGLYEKRFVRSATRWEF